MKKLYKKIGVIISVVILISSCSDWLDVEPKAEIKAELLFKTEQGFMDALIGCYQKMSERSLYGGELTVLFMESLGQNYDYQYTSYSPYRYTNTYDYSHSSCEAYIQKIWLGMYNVICNVNKIIEDIEINKSNISATKYALIKGEAYGLRAFLYTDLLRLFTWGDLAKRGPEFMNKLAIPYPKNYDKEIVKQSTLKEVLENIHSDLEVAYNLLYLYDPISRPDNRPEDYVMSEEDPYYKGLVRSYRITVNGVMATRMRLNLWEGNYREAYDDAKFLKKHVAWVGDSRINNSDETKRDLTFSTEQIFGVETYKRFDSYVQSLFQERDGGSMNYKGFYISKNRANSIYEINENIGTSDYRYLRLLNKEHSKYIFIKYWEYEKMQYTNKMPLIKTPEVFYTAAECLLHLDDEKDAKKTSIKLINEVRAARGIADAVRLTDDLSKEEIYDEIYKEYRKEFIGDGQMFYFYKRLGYTAIPNTKVSISDAVYVLPMPDSEVNIGNRQQLINDDQK